MRNNTVLKRWILIKSLKELIGRILGIETHYDIVIDTGGSFVNE